jgi:protease-4
MSTHDDFQPTQPPSSEPTPARAAAAPIVPPPLTPPWGRVDGLLEQFALEYLRDRRSERRWRLFVRLSWLAVLAAGLWFVLTARNHGSVQAGPHTALVEVRGEIGVDTEASAELLVGALRSAFEESSSEAVVLRINSPGGSPVQAGIVNAEIQRLKALHRKKVYAVVEEMCASGAYYIAVAADEIYADKASIVGSIGVLMDGFGFPGLMAKLGIERRLFTAGENKVVGDPFLPLSAKHRAYTQAMLDQIHRQFIDTVKQGRGNRLKITPETFSGLYWNGEEAVKLGLADRLGSLDYVAREVVKAEEVIDYTPRENVAERLAKRFGASIGAGAVKALASMGTIR